MAGKRPHSTNCGDHDASPQISASTSAKRLRPSSSFMRYKNDRTGIEIEGNPQDIDMVLGNIHSRESTLYFSENIENRAQRRFDRQENALQRSHQWRLAKAKHTGIFNDPESSDEDDSSEDEENGITAPCEISRNGGYRFLGTMALRGQTEVSPSPEAMSAALLTPLPIGNLLKAGTFYRTNLPYKRDEQKDEMLSMPLEKQFVSTVYNLVIGTDASITFRATANNLDKKFFWIQVKESQCTSENDGKRFLKVFKTPRHFL